MLARTHKVSMAGHSNPTGFFLFGELPTEEVRAALNEAYSRLRSGESGLAVHPGCGTNLVATAFPPRDDGLDADLRRAFQTAGDSCCCRCFGVLASSAFS